jgi:hypothetical protein
MATSERTSSVTIRFSKPGTQPPIFLAGSFSDPEWEPQEMKHETKADGELEFTKEVSVQEGKQYQYKFRVGEGEWWVLNEQAPIGKWLFNSTYESYSDSQRSVNCFLALAVGIYYTILTVFFF